MRRLDLGLYSHPKELLGNGVRKIASTGKILLRGGSNPRRCITQDSEPNTLPAELFRPLQLSEGTHTCECCQDVEQPRDGSYHPAVVVDITKQLTLSVKPRDKHSPDKLSPRGVATQNIGRYAWSRFASVITCKGGVGHHVEFVLWGAAVRMAVHGSVRVSYWRFTPSQTVRCSVRSGRKPLLLLLLL